MAGNRKVNDEFIFKIDKDIIRETISVNGGECQKLICMEEPAELIQAISKMERDDTPVDIEINKMRRYNVKEEIADTIICLATLLQIYNIQEPDIQKIIEKKQRRQKTRNCNTKNLKTLAKNLFGNSETEKILEEPKWYLKTQMK